MQVHLTELNLEPILGLPSILKMSPAELRDFIAQTHGRTDMALLCMQMYYVLMALSQDDAALDMQERALTLQRAFRIVGPDNPKIRLLAIMGPGNMLDNTPLDFIVESNSIQLELLYLFPSGELPAEIPEHDIAFIAIGESAKNERMLEALDAIYETWPRPIVNKPAKVCNCSRDVCYRILQGVPELVIPKTQRIDRYEVPKLVFPMTIRPIDTHGGNGLKRLDSVDQLSAYYEEFPSNAYYVGDYVDYQSEDGYFRKIRLVIIDGAAFICHLAISDNWIVHYLSAGMELDERKRAEEERVMQTFEEDFAVRFKSQIDAVAGLLDLDYVTVDCAEMRDGRLLIFEVDTRGLVHAADPVEIYPYKPAAMQRAFNAFESMLERRIEYEI